MNDQQILLDQQIRINAADIQESGGIFGDYNLEHLKRFHVALLQDTDKFNFNLNPGELRSQNLEGFIYQRDRIATLNNNGLRFNFFSKSIFFFLWI